MPIWKPAGTLPPNQAVLKASAFEASPSTKIADCPGVRLDTPFSATALASRFDSSSNFQPVRSIVVVPVLVSSHQSAA